MKLVGYVSEEIMEKIKKNIKTFLY
ncbi:hypothetical protein [Candidatus Brocadia sinica]